MKILIHTMTFFPANGPRSKRFFGLALHLEKKGVEIDVVTTSYQSKFGTKNIRLYRYFGTNFPTKSNFLRLINYLSFMLSSVLHAFKFKKYDYVIATSPPIFSAITAFVISKVTKAKFIFDVRDIWPEIALEMEMMTKKSFSYHIIKRIANILYKHSEYVFVVTQSKKVKIAEMYPEYQNKVRLISNGFDEEYDLINFSSSSYSELHSQEYVFYGGNLGYAQGLETLLDLAKSIQEQSKIKFIIAGTGAAENHLKNHAVKNKIDNVIFLGKIPNEEVIMFLKNAKFSYVSLVNSNLKDSVPTKLFETLGVGCPTLLIADGESADIAHKSKIALVAKPGDTNDIKLKFQKMLVTDFSSDINHSKKFIRENYSRRAIAEKLYKVLSGASK